MPRSKSKSKKVLGKPKRKLTDKDLAKKTKKVDPGPPPEPTPPGKDDQTVPPSAPAPKPAETKKADKKARCFTCGECNLSITNVGFCRNQDVRKVLEGWDGIITYPQKFSCIYHKEGK